MTPVNTLNRIWHPPLHGIELGAGDFGPEHPRARLLSRSPLPNQGGDTKRQTAYEQPDRKRTPTRRSPKGRRSWRRQAKLSNASGRPRRQLSCSDHLPNRCVGRHQGNAHNGWGETRQPSPIDEVLEQQLDVPESSPPTTARILPMQLQIGGAKRVCSCSPASPTPHPGPALRSSTVGHRSSVSGTHWGIDIPSVCPLCEVELFDGGRGRPASHTGATPKRSPSA